MREIGPGDPDLSRDPCTAFAESSGFVMFAGCDICGEAKACVDGPYYAAGGLEAYACCRCRGDYECEECRGD